MKVLLTGSNGWLGTHIREKSKHSLNCVSRSIGRDMFNLKSSELEGVDAIIHAAAKLGVSKSWDNRFGFMSTNVLGTAHMADLARKARVKRFIFISTCAAEPIESPYGASKKAAEDVLEGYKDILDVTVLRLFNVYGKGWRKNSPQVVSIFKDRTKKKWPIEINGGDQQRDFIYVDDVCEIIDNVIEKKEYKRVDVGTGIGTRIDDLANMMSKRVIVKDSKKEAKHSVAEDPTLARELLGREFTTLEEGIKLIW